MTEQIRYLGKYRIITMEILELTVAVHNGFFHVALTSNWIDKLISIIIVSDDEYYTNDSLFDDWRFDGIEGKTWRVGMIQIDRI